MNVQELIEELNQIKDKTLLVKFVDDDDNVLGDVYIKNIKKHVIYLSSCYED
jgi:hypothetical protein